MRKIVFILSASFLLASCQDEVTGTNPDLIPRATLEQVLYDMQLADVYSLSVRKDTTEHYGIKNQDSLSRYYNEILKHHQLTYERFKQTMDWYREHPPELDTVYTNVLNRMSAAEEKYKYTNAAEIAKPEPVKNPAAE
ncbi:MAG: DUF4296 domain-containing protein [Flavipsychrobacter sp.]|nr:DUF4296 domain-containing protein [Flavipsychrobacter sp.]